MNTIFLAEDDEYIARVYTRAFRIAGYELVVVTDGEAALQSLSSIDPLPQAIILDVSLPKTSGLNVLKSLRSNSRFEHIPVAILTNSFPKETEEQFKSAGANLYMIKIEYKPGEVVEKIEQLIKDHVTTNKS